MNARAQPGSMLALATGRGAIQHEPPASAVRRHSMDDGDTPPPRATVSKITPAAAVTAGAPKSPAKSREFGTADKALIRSVHSFMPPAQLLALLNERLTCDVGPGAVPYTMEQLRAEIAAMTGAVATGGGHDWVNLRKILAKAKADGVLDAINEQVIDDFAVVFALNDRQVMMLKDVLLQANDSEEEAQ